VETGGSSGDRRAVVFRVPGVGVFETEEMARRVVMCMEACRFKTKRDLQLMVEKSRKRAARELKRSAGDRSRRKP